MDSNKITICFLQRNINESGTQSNRNKAKWNILNELSQNMYLKSQIKHEQKKICDLQCVGLLSRSDNTKKNIDSFNRSCFDRKSYVEMRGGHAFHTLATNMNDIETRSH